MVVSMVAEQNVEFKKLNMSETNKLGMSSTNVCYPVSYEIRTVIYQNSVSLNLAAGLAGLICGISTILIAFFLRKRIKSKVGGSKKENIGAWQWFKRRETLDKLELEVQHNTYENQIQRLSTR
uniref:Uncharacterized protein n=1 Tax=Romanomermis culicivorax TaxID=13658 RepID=A0A915IB71_ROMCU